MTYDMRALSRSFKIIECLSEAGKPLTAADVSRRAGLHRATAHRILVALVQLGYVHKSEHESSYTTGYYLHTFGYSGDIVKRITHQSRKFLQELSAGTGETVHLGALEGTCMIFCDQIAGFDGVGLIGRIGMRREAHATAIGKALLAFQPVEDVRLRYEGRKLQRLTRKTTTNIASLLRSLADVRRQGYATDDEESEVGLRSVASAIVNPAGRATCAVSIVFPARRLAADRLHVAGEKVRLTAKAILDHIVCLEGTGFASGRQQVAVRRTKPKPAITLANGKSGLSLNG